MSDRTKLWIAEKMKEIMKDKPIEQIRITEICKAAEIERSTFYYHFKDKYDLVAWIFFHSVKDINLLSIEEATHHMEQIKKDILFYQRAYADTSQNSLWKYMFSYFFHEYSAIAKKRTGRENLDAQTSFSIRLYCYGATEMAREWILYDNKTPAETIIQMMFSSMPDFLKKIYFD